MGKVARKSKPPSVKQGWLWGRWIRCLEYRQPILFRLFEKGVAVDIVHNHDPEHGGQPRKAPRALDTLLYDHE